MYLCFLTIILPDGFLYDSMVPLLNMIGIVGVFESSLYAINVSNVPCS